MPSPRSLLESFTPVQEFLVCIDSDGCAFDTMGIKQRECFCPWMIEAFNLQPVAEAARACKEFADLFSKTRGANRHMTIKRILTELLPSHPQVSARGFSTPQYRHYFQWIENPDSLLSDEGLRQAVAAAKDSSERLEFEHILEWSERVNWAVKQIVSGIPPFLGVREVLVELQGRADVVVVSATPLEALEREWAEHDIDPYVALICGQEMGTKKEHIETVGETYQCDRVLMVGDAPGDLRAAQANGVLFYPIIPGKEEKSWSELISEGLPKFLAGEYRGLYENELLDRFERALPEHPPWEVKK
ncbi:MAG: HAD hydrolase-like protein [Candidatus Bipolaricaulota bacterium]